MDERNRDIADTNAETMAVFSLFADVHIVRNFTQVVQTISTGNMDDDATDTKVAESLEQTMRQSFSDLHIHGLQPLKTARLKHFITGSDIHVSVYGINAEDAAAVMEIQEESAKTAIAIHQNQAWRRGRNEEIRRQVETAQNDPASRKAGAAAVKAKETGERTTSTQQKTAIPGAIMSNGPADEDW